jgi:hypothetical protein
MLESINLQTSACAAGTKDYLVAGLLLLAEQRAAHTARTKVPV